MLVQGSRVVNGNNSKPLPDHGDDGPCCIAPVFCGDRSAFSVIQSRSGLAGRRPAVPAIPLMDDLPPCRLPPQAASVDVHPGITTLSGFRHGHDTPPLPGGTANRLACRAAAALCCGFSPYVLRLDASLRRSCTTPATTDLPRLAAAPDSVSAARATVRKSPLGSSRN